MPKIMVDINVPDDCRKCQFCYPGGMFFFCTIFNRHIMGDPRPRQCIAAEKKEKP